MDYRKFTIIVVSIAVVGFAMYKQKGSEVEPLIESKTVVEQTAISTFEKMATLPPVDEADLQKQIQGIIAKGKEFDCELLPDARYKYACHDFFRNIKNKI